MARTKQTGRRAKGTSGGDMGAARRKQETSSGKEVDETAIYSDSSLDSEKDTKKRARDDEKKPFDDDDDDDDEPKVQPKHKVQRTESSASAAEGNNHVDACGNPVSDQKRAREDEEQVDPGNDGGGAADDDQPERKVQCTESSASAAEGNNHVDVHEQFKQFMAKRKPHKTRVGDFATVETVMVLPQGQFSTRVIYDDHKAAGLCTPVMECYRADTGLVAILNHSNVVSRVKEQSRDPSWNRKD